MCFSSYTAVKALLRDYKAMHVHFEQAAIDTSVGHKKNVQSTKAF